MDKVISINYILRICLFELHLIFTKIALDMASDKVDFDELLVNIKSTRNVNEIKEKLDKEVIEKTIQLRKAAEKRGKRRPSRREKTQADREVDAAFEEQRRRQHQKVLEAPLHRQAQHRIESKIAYRQTKDEIRQWDPIVQGLRVAEQLQFPHDERRDDPLAIQTGEERAKSFNPRTELEKRVYEVLAHSKHNIRNDESYSQAERELLKAMDVKEAKQKCDELRKMRSLMSFHAAKMKRQSKIKSKQFHRIRKRTERRKLIKEVEEILVRDPEKADEKLKELEKDRAYERATLKHRGTNKWTKQVRKFATRNPELRKVVEDHLRLGRELKSRHGIEGAGESDSGGEESNLDEKKELSSDELIKLAVDKVESDGLEAVEKALPSGKNPFYRSALEQIKLERRSVIGKAKNRAVAEESPVAEGRAQPSNKQSEMGKKDDEDDDDEKFLDLNLRPLVQIPPELADDADSDTDVQRAFMAEAYEEDDVLDDFRVRKQRVEDDERPKPKIGKFLRGWGAWTGPGISEESEKRREERLFGEEAARNKRRVKRRKDAQRPGVIIHEAATSERLQRLQPKDVPFPFTRIQDFEAYIQQPLGRDWNTPIAHQQLVKPTVLTKAGRIIRPLDKKLKKRRKMLAEIIEAGED